MFDLHHVLCDQVMVSKNVTKMAYIVVWVHTNVFPSLEDAFSHSISQLKKVCDQKIQKKYAQPLDTNWGCFCQRSWHCSLHQIWLQKNIMLAWRIHWNTFRQMTFFSLSQARDLYKADGERTSPISPCKHVAFWVDSIEA